MEVLLFVLLVAVLLITVGIRNRMNSLEGDLRSTRLQMQELMVSLARRAQAPNEHSTPPPPAPEPAPEAPATPFTGPLPGTFGGLDLEHEAEPQVVEESRPPIITPPPRSWVEAQEEPIREDAPQLLVEEPADPPPFTPPPPPPPRPSFMERNPDLEKFIGENLINKIGIAILVLGLGLLLQYTIGRGYLGETAQTLIGVASGGVLLFLGHRLRDNFRAFSSVLVGGGLAVLYFSIAFAFQKFHLIGQTAAFAFMVLITALGVLLTLAYDRRELAIIALLGGFATPFLVSSGEGNYKVLFTYLLILNAGMLVLANYKKWSILNILAFALSWLLFLTWSMTSYTSLEPRPVAIAFAFATAFYAAFFAMILLYDLRHRSTFIPLDYGLFVANTAVYFGVGMHFLTDLDVRVGGLFCVLLAAVNVVFALRFFRDERVPRNLVYLLIGVVLTFISLAAPVQLQGDHITLFWAAEGVLLLWFARRSGIRLVERTSVLVTILMAISLGMDLWGYMEVQPTPLLPVANRLFITGLVSLAALVLQVRLWAKWPADHRVFGDLQITTGIVQGIYIAAAAVLGYTLGLLELEHQLAKVLPAGTVFMAGMSFRLLYLLAVDSATRGRATWLRTAVGVLFGLAFLMLITMHYGIGMQQLRSDLLGRVQGTGHHLAHYLTFALTVLLVLRAMRWSREVLTLRSPYWNVYAWVICSLLVVLASQELDHLLLAVQSAGTDAYALDHALYKARTAGYPILWGIGSFLFMLYGMRARVRMVRIIALTLFGITLGKLFLFDIRGASEGARVAAFISLGVLLLVISFLYQKLKVLLKDDADAPTN